MKTPANRTGLLLALVLCLTACQPEQVGGPQQPPEGTHDGAHENDLRVDTAEVEPRSEFGIYRGYSNAEFDGFERQSQYVEVSDGTRIAIDIFHPTAAGLRAGEPMPVAFQVTRYWRAYEKEDGSILTGAGEIAPQTNALLLKDPTAALEPNENVNTNQELLRHGYVLVVMDSRGTGASFGVQTQALMLEINDMGDVMDWIVEQPWSTDKIGMFGASWLGFIQLIAALGRNEALAALFPAVANFVDFTRIGSPRGAYIKGAMLTMRKTLVGLSEMEDAGQGAKDALASIFGEGIIGPATVDADSDGSLRAEARAAQGSATFEMYIAAVLAHPAIQQAIEALELDTPDKVIDTLFYADALNLALQDQPELRQVLLDAQWPQQEQSLAAVDFVLGTLNQVDVPTYLWDGWQDPGPNERMLWYYNLDGPRRLTMGPWSHGPNEQDDASARAYTALMTTEILRWFDHWLKGIDNGIVNEEPLVYAVMQDRENWEWRHDNEFPPADSTALQLYFSAGPSGSVASVNDGGLSRERTAGHGSKDVITVDYTANSGSHTRYHDATGGGPIEYPDFAANDAKGLTYTTAPLEEDILTAGFPLITLHAEASIADPVFVVYLEEVTATGQSTMISQGSIRASHRTPWEPPYKTNGIPWTSSLVADVSAAESLSEGPAKIHFALEPVSNRWDKGNRIRVSVLNADETVIWVIPQDPPPRVTLWRDAEFASHIELRVIPGKWAE